MDIWIADLNPTIGSEQAGLRPFVIISGNLLNKHLKIVIAVPLTSKIKKYVGNPILEPNTRNNLKYTSEMLVFHIRSISKERLVEKIGEISKEELDQTLRTLKDLTTF